MESNRGFLDSQSDVSKPWMNSVSIIALSNRSFADNEICFSIQNSFTLASVATFAK